MNEIKLAEGIYWVGAMDWNIRFCGSYNTPFGTTYNAYLIVDEKIALVDTVKTGFFDEMVRRIRDIIDPRDIDYVIVNHVEMDHSGALPELMKIARNAKVMTTEKGRDGLVEHYAGDWDFKTVKTGDEINLGKKTLQFIEAPMLHWPDSMFTYIKEHHILMSNDAFGQHIATSQRFEDEIGEAIIMREAGKYFASILLPYAPLILKKIKEIQDKGIEIDMIAPAHGAIWRKEPSRVIDSYIRWAKGEGRDKVVIVYDTMWESTDKMAKAILSGITDEGVEASLYNLRNSDWTGIAKEILDSRGILIGTPTLNRWMYPSVAGFLAYMRGLNPRNKLWGTFGSYGWGGGGVRAVNEELERGRFDVISSLRVKYVPDEEAHKKCFELGKTFAKEIKKRR